MVRYCRFPQHCSSMQRPANQLFQTFVYSQIYNNPLMFSQAILALRGCLICLCLTLCPIHSFKASIPHNGFHSQLTYILYISIYTICNIYYNLTSIKNIIIYFLYLRNNYILTFSLCKYILLYCVYTIFQFEDVLLDYIM